MEGQIKFAQWCFDTGTGVLQTPQGEKHLEPTVARLLLYFLSNQHRLVSRDELVEHVWRGRIVSDDPINRGISVLRQALNPDNKVAFIQTIPRRGYKAAFPPLEQISNRKVVIAPLQSDVEAMVSRQPLLGSISSRAIELGFIGVIALIVAVLLYPWAGEQQAPPLPRIAVLPFDDLTGTNSSHIAEGISDTVITQLAKVRGLHVTARTSSFAFAGQNLTASEIAARLAVEHILEGSLQYAGDNLRVIARLVDTRTQAEIWSDVFERPKTELFAVQDDIARATAVALIGAVLPNGDRYEPEYATFELVLQGKQSLAQQTESGAQQALQFFRQANALEPEYPLPYVLIAQTLQRQVETDAFTHIYPSGQQSAVREEVEQLLSEALKRDPGLAQAHALQARVWLNEGDIESAGKALSRALQLSPNDEIALAVEVDTLYAQGRREEGVVRARQAVALNPESNALRQRLAMHLWALGRNEEALRIVEDNLLRFPKAGNNYSLLARWHLQLGEPGQALLYAVEERALDPKNPNRWWGVCLTQFQLWQYAAWQNCTHNLLVERPSYYEARSYQLGFSGQTEAYHALVKAQIERYPAEPYYKLQLANSYMRGGEYARVVPLLNAVYPSLNSPSPRINDLSVWGAYMLMYTLDQLGEEQQATRIAEAGLAYARRNRPMLGAGYYIGVEEVIFLSQLGRHEEALSKFLELLERGWSLYSFGLEQTPTISTVVADPQAQLAIKAHRQFLNKEYNWALAQLRAAERQDLLE